MIEREAKFELDLEQPVPRLDGAGPVARQGDPVRATLEGTYYDTDDYRLILAGITLRRRTGGNDPGWHLKLPHSFGQRRELTEPLGAPSEPPPLSLTRHVREQTGDRELFPVARIRTTRYAHPLRDAQNTLVATLLDDHVTAESAVDPASLDSWRELEIELALPSADTVLDTLTTAAQHLGSRPAGWPSKLHRALDSVLPARDHSGQHPQ